jgi:hypothetical protein
LNGVDEQLSPYLAATMPKAVDLNQIGTFITSMAQAGAPLFPDETLEAHLRQIAGLPTGESEEV